MNDTKDLERFELAFNENMHNTKLTLFSATYAYENNELTLLCGDAGAGKTTALKMYAEQNEYVVYISANASCRSSRAILTALLSELHLDTTGLEPLMMARLIEYFKAKKRLLIVDEADHLVPRALQSLRHLNDEAKLGIVFSGNDKIHHQMYGRGSLQYDQLRTRIASRVKVVNSYTLDELQQIFINVDDDCIIYLLKIACNESLRTAIKCYNATVKVCLNNNIKMSPKTIKTVQQQLFNGAM